MINLILVSIVQFIGAWQLSKLMRAKYPHWNNKQFFWRTWGIWTLIVITVSILSAIIERN